MKVSKTSLVFFNVIVILVGIILFFAYLALKSSSPQSIAGGQHGAVKHDYQIKTEDSTLINRSHYGYVFNNGHRCEENFPLGATWVDDSLSQQSILFCYQRYAVQYSVDNKTPIWVAQVLRKEDFKNPRQIQRTDDFREDDHIKGEAFSSKPQEYVRSGFDKGHLAPAADFSYDKDAMSESFIMTNIVPQAPAHNRGVWSDLEKATRQLLRYKEVNELYVTTGVLYYQQNQFPKIGQGIKVPNYLYKVIVEPKTGQSAAFLIPNTNEATYKPYQQYLIKIKQLEEIAKVDFHSGLSKELAKKVEDENSGGLIRFMQ